MAATTASWLSKIENCSTEQLHQMRDSLLEDLNKHNQRKRVLDEQVSRIKMDVGFVEANLSVLNAKLNNKNLTDANFNKYQHLVITDHAVLRYIERMLGITVEGIKRDIINGFPDSIPLNAECIKTGKTVYRIVKDKDRIILITIIKKKR